jgi:hypothetical protein
MKWIDFLTDPELNNSPQKPDGRYLFGKILHDTLECLNAYKGYLELIHKEEFPPGILNWFNSKSPKVESLLTQITALWRYPKELPETSEQWPKLIEEVGQILLSADLLFDFDRFALPIEEDKYSIAEGAIKALKTLKILSQDIQTKEYKRLLTVQKYSLLV